MIFIKYLFIIFFIFLIIYILKKNKKFKFLLFNNFFIIFFLGIILYLLYLLFKTKKEGFTWSEDTITKFKTYQNTSNPKIIYDIKNIQEQASEEEVHELLSTGLWPWDSSTQELFMENIQKNTIIKTLPEEALDDARKIYNQNITKQMLAWKAPEGKFLLTGILLENLEKDLDENTYGIKSGLVSKKNDIIRCGSNNTGDMVIQRIHNIGNDSITGLKKKNITYMDNQELPNIVPNFKFINSPCNPCKALNMVPDYSCPFTINKNNNISKIWKSLWGIV